MCKIFAFSGSHGVGKTSLVNQIFSQLAENTNNIKYKMFKEFNTGFHNMGFALNGIGADMDEVIFSQQQAFNLGYNTIDYYLSRTEDQRLIIMDRSCIDTYLYTEYFLTKANNTNYQAVLNDMKKKSAEVENAIFTYLLPPFKNFEQTDIRMGITERDEIWSNFQIYFNDNKDSKLLDGVSTRERYNEFTASFINNTKTPVWLKLLKLA